MMSKLKEPVLETNYSCNLRVWHIVHGTMYAVIIAALFANLILFYIKCTYSYYYFWGTLKILSGLQQNND